jgi:hypothetical protein
MSVLVGRSTAGRRLSRSRRGSENVEGNNDYQEPAVILLSSRDLADIKNLAERADRMLHTPNLDCFTCRMRDRAAVWLDLSERQAAHSELMDGEQ